MRIRRIAVLIGILFLPASAGVSPAARNDKSSADDLRALSTAALFKETFEYERALSALSGTAPARTEEVDRYAARLHLLAGQAEQASALLAPLSKKDWIDYVYLGLASESAGRTHEAKTYYERSLEQSPNTIALFRLGKIYRQRRSFAKAADYFLKVIEHDASVRLAYYYLGQCLKERDNHREAYRYLAKARTFYPERDTIEREFASVKERAGTAYLSEQSQQKETQRSRVTLAPYAAKPGGPRVRVGLATDTNGFSFSCAKSFTVKDTKNSWTGKPNTLYSMTAKEKKLAILERETRKLVTTFGESVTVQAPADASGAGSFRVIDVAYGKKDFWYKNIDRTYRGILEARAGEKGVSLINVVTLEEYVYGVLASEIPASSPAHALRAQAVCARTLAFRGRNRHKKEGFDLCADVHCQVYQGLSVEKPQTNAAVDATRGEILVYDSKPIEAFYHACCGGCLASDAFGPAPYLTTKADGKTVTLPQTPYEEDQWFMEKIPAPCESARSKYRWQRCYDAEDFKIAFGQDLSDVQRITLQPGGDCFHYTSVSVESSGSTSSVSGDLGVRTYFDRLRSSAFKLEILFDGQTPQMLVFWGAGFGHGAGLCQEGAMAMGAHGSTYNEILSHYYPKAQLKNEY